MKIVSKLIEVLKISVLAFFWLVFSPVFYFLSKWWYASRRKMRKVLFFVSPLVIIIALYLSLYTYMLTNDALMGSKWSIEEKTVLEFPSYRRNHLLFLSNLLKNNSFSSLRSENNLSFTAKLKPSQCEAFFMEIDQLIQDSAYNNPKEIEILGRSWSIDGSGNYSFSYIRQQPEETLNITINPKTYEMFVSVGRW